LRMLRGMLGRRLPERTLRRVLVALRAPVRPGLARPDGLRGLGALGMRRRRRLLPSA
jgi:hypothetical protein